MKNEIREYLTANRASASHAEFSDCESLLEAGVIDSVTMVDLITFMESRYGITVDEDDMIPENFDTVDAIVSYVEGKRESIDSNVDPSASVG